MYFFCPKPDQENRSLMKEVKTDKYIYTSLQILIASIMCSYNKEDWTELAKMAEVSGTLLKTSF